jgi:hypothetical protein
MNVKHLRSYALGVAAALISLPMYAAMNAQPQNFNLVSASAVLTQPLNSRSTRQGQSVTAKLTSNVKTAEQLELPKGTVLTGKVEQVQDAYARSRISIVFNRARLRNGHEIPVKATLLAAYPPALVGEAQGPSSYMMIQPRTIPSNQKIDQEPGTLSHITMRSAVQSDVSGVFLSKNHDINLDRGTRLQLAIAPESNASSTMSGT